MGTMIDILVSLLYVASAAVLMVTGVEKVRAPSALTKALHSAGRTGIGVPVVIGLGAVELSVGFAALALASSEWGRTLAAALVVGYLAAVAPVGVFLLRRTGDCGCGGIGARRGVPAWSQTLQLLSRNALMVAGTLGFAGGHRHDGAALAAGVAVGVVLAVQGGAVFKQAADHLRPIAGINPPLTVPK